MLAPYGAAPDSAVTEFEGRKVSAAGERQQPSSQVPTKAQAIGAARNRLDDDHRAILLQSMRVAVLNLRTWQIELETIGVALSRDQITIDTAIAWLDEMDVLGWMAPPIKMAP